MSIRQIALPGSLLAAFPGRGIGDRSGAATRVRAQQADAAAVAMLVRLRWAALTVMAAGAALAQALGVLDSARPIHATVAVVALVNLGLLLSGLARRSDPPTLAAQLVLDLTALTLVLHFAGGIANPLVMLYVVHAILAAILLPAAHAYAVAAFGCIALKTVAAAEWSGMLQHHPLRLPATPELDVTSTLVHQGSFVLLVGAVCVALMATSTFFVSRVMARLHRRERALGDTRTQLQAAIDSIEDGIVLFGLDGRPLACNRSIRCTACPVAAGARQGPACAPCEACPLWPYEREPAALVGSLLAARGGSRRSLVRESGDRVLRHRLFPVQATGAGLGMVWVREDITETRRLEQQSRHQDRMAAVGLLAAGVAHEIRNPLASISAIVEDTRTALENEAVREDLDLVGHQVRRISGILGQLSGLARPAQNGRSPIEPADFLDEVVQVVRFDPRSRDVEIRVHLDPETPSILASRDEMVQLFLNLVLNAIEAMPAGGTLLIAGRPRGSAAGIDVQDTGLGIAPEALERIFDPFFTSKTTGVGAGLGLSVCANIVRAHGGHIEVASTVGQGTVFRVTLPAVPAATARHGAQDSAAWNADDASRTWCPGSTPQDRIALSG